MAAARLELGEEQGDAFSVENRVLRILHHPARGHEAAA
eukprot:CAMPEP_0113999542 /NCGR_PEP_ID=MMETSP0328-20130328/13439_1 /TAXON_ID=39455 /ORGANISM="Alexandrium minutum" /LENGTH=37 /assembly_acc=CAM_ASM_000350